MIEQEAPEEAVQLARAAEDEQAANSGTGEGRQDIRRHMAAAAREVRAEGGRKV